MAKQTEGAVPYKPALHMGVEVKLPRRQHESMPMGRGLITDIHTNGKVDVWVYPSETLSGQHVRVPGRPAATADSGWWEPTAATERR